MRILVSTLRHEESLILRTHHKEDSNKLSFEFLRLVPTIVWRSLLITFSNLTSLHMIDE